MCPYACSVAVSMHPSILQTFPCTSSPTSRTIPSASGGGGSTRNVHSNALLHQAQRSSNCRLNAPPAFVQDDAVQRQIFPVFGVDAPPNVTVGPRFLDYFELHRFTSVLWCDTTCSLAQRTPPGGCRPPRFFGLKSSHRDVSQRETSRLEKCTASASESCPLVPRSATPTLCCHRSCGPSTCESFGSDERSSQGSADLRRWRIQLLRGISVMSTHPTRVRILFHVVLNVVELAPNPPRQAEARHKLVRWY